MDRAAESFRSDLLARGLLVETKVDGLYGRSAAYERLIDALDRLIVESAVDQRTISLRFPPIVARAVLERSGYVSSFPNLMGSVHTFIGDDKGHVELRELAESGDNYSHLLEPVEVALSSAVCHPLYAMCAGVLPEGGSRYEVYGWCFRHEPSLDPMRMQAFRMQEFVYLGDSEAALDFRDRWLNHGSDLLRGLGLEVSTVVANDPFFGRAGKVLAHGQLDEVLKYEITTTLDSYDSPTAIASSNLHRDHFGRPFGIETASGGVAESACFAFGVDRIALSLFNTHGYDTDRWPSSVRNRLWS